MSRYKGCAELFKLDTVIRITSDCPLINTDCINEGIKDYVKEADPYVYVSNTIQRTYPRGFDFEIFSYETLLDAFINARLPEDLEHVTPYIWKNKSGNIRIRQICDDSDNSNIRLTLDTMEDFTLLKILFENFDANRLTYVELVELFRKNADLMDINSSVEQKKIG